MRDTPRQISHSKRPCPIYDLLTQFKCPIDRLNLVLRHGVRFRHRSLFCVNSSSAARALCGIGIAAYVATFLINIFHFPLYHSCLEKASPHTWRAERLRSWTWRHLYIRRCVTWMEIIPDRRRSIAHHKINMLNAEYIFMNAENIFLRSNLPI